VLVHTTDRSRNAVEVDVARDAIGRRFVELRGDAHRELRIALEAERMSLVERTEVRAVAEHRLLDVALLVVGGGETSGAVVTALKIDQFRIGPQIDPGVPALAVEGDRPLRLALKSGNFGSSDFYEKALAALGTP